MSARYVSRSRTSHGSAAARAGRGSSVVRPKGGPGGVRCVLSACRVQALVLDVLGLVPGAASGGTSHALEAVGERAGRRPAGGTSVTGPGSGAAVAGSGRGSPSGATKVSWATA